MDIELAPPSNMRATTARRCSAISTRPRQAAHYPAIVAVHGGGWQLGSRESYRYWGRCLAARGYALFAAGYRLSKPGEPSFPGAVHDIRAAVQFVKGSGAALKLDRDPRRADGRFGGRTSRGAGGARRRRPGLRRRLSRRCPCRAQHARSRPWSASMASMTWCSNGTTISGRGCAIRSARNSSARRRSKTGGSISTPRR